MTRLDGQLLNTVTSSAIIYNDQESIQSSNCYNGKAYMLSEWSCETCQDLVSLYYHQLLHCDDICKPKSKCTKKSLCTGLH